MSLRYSFKKAQSLLSRFGPEEMAEVRSVCTEIQAAQHELGLSARTNLNRCYHACEGLCCRNVEIDSIIDHWDFIFLLASDDSLEAAIAPCLEKENLLFAADCIFLFHGTGPCMFPDGVRPRVCIISFCTETPALDREIRQVKKVFNKLFRKMWMLRIKAFFRPPPLMS